MDFPYYSRTNYRANKNVNAMGNLWECISIDLPYNEEHQLFFPYISHSLHFAKIRAHISSIPPLYLSIPFPYMGHIIYGPRFAI